MAKVKARKDAVSTTASKNIEAWLRSMPGVTVYQAHARFISAREIAVGAERIRADKVFIDVGGRAIVPAIPGLDTVPYLTNTSILELDAVPEHLIVLGGSYIGLEFAQIFRRFGAPATKPCSASPRLWRRTCTTRHCSARCSSTHIYKLISNSVGEPGAAARPDKVRI